MSNSMTRAEREAFLADLHVGVFSVADGDATITVPIWYDYEPGGDVWIITGPDGPKGQALAATGRYSICAQTESLPYTYVSVEGPVASVEPCTEEQRLAMAVRYLGEELAQGYIASTASEADSSTIFRMTPEKWRTVDYGKSR